ncbi:MAG: VIT domain-containing protein [Fuerstiella sp.]
MKTQPPLSELRLVKRLTDIDESKFVVGSSLSQDGRAGRVVDRQGVVSLRPLTRSRWTPVDGPVLIMPGDWLRTDVRGANAATVELVSRYRVIVGPGSLVELAQPNTIVLHDGEVQIIGSNAAMAPVQLIGPEEQTLSVAADETVLYRLNQQQELVRVNEKPVWLAGYEGSSNEESIGSLIANVDGRDTPLTVGFHKVNVEIRDQIARTTIEESFVNHTGSRLEGIFHFPLPQDASISGFGMWIGGQLIEADLVEKQRAREIYETILRENRDPGLLEWTGGNIFKARVFPIEAHSEKRIKVVYTQVLPLRAQKFRYSYGLRSELLQKNPLRELSVNVLVNSALPLKSVDCATHPARVQQAKHSGQVEFSVQEYTPTRDFEVVCELDTQQSDVVVIPHRRGDDGYFLAQVMPPSPAGNWQREVLPDGAPLNVLLVCDTSGSMDSQHRETQQQFVASVLNALGPEDQFNVAVCDVDTEWKFEQSIAVSEDAQASTLAWLEGRRSLGWTNLDVVGASVERRLNDATHVIYIGDGIVTADDADPQTFVNRWKRKTNSWKGGTFHAVSVGSSFESTVLKAIAAVGGGSVRQVSGEQTPARVARELLNEIAQPGLRDLKVEFKGVEVAAVYPQTLPNLAAGKQQIIVGRYLPQGNEQSGQMTVTGFRNGEAVKYVSKIVVKDAEQGNSFIPRLWARAHLDHLLEQGAGQSIQDQIIALSEEFHIITPYTSLLVLETDADRERFGVKRRFLMRDGERFFADGRSSANFELVQQQMKAAGNWRLGLRMQILRSLSNLGRNTTPQAQQAAQWRYQRSAGERQLRRQLPGLAGGQASGPWDETDGIDFDGMKKLDGLSLGFALEETEVLPARGREIRTRDSDHKEASDNTFFAKLRSSPARVSSLRAVSEEQLGESRLDLFSLNGRRDRDQAGEWSGNGFVDLVSELNHPVRLNLAMKGEMFRSEFSSIGGRGRHRGRLTPSEPDYTGWMNQLFPAVPVPPQPRPVSVHPEWPEEVMVISRALVQELSLPDSHGLEIKRDHIARDPRWKRETSRTSATQLYRPDQWLSWSWVPGQHTVVNWCDEEIRGAWSKSFELGRTRRATMEDVTSVAPGQRPFADVPLHQSYAKYTVELLPQVGELTTLVLTPETGNGAQITLKIDRSRNVVVRTETKYNDDRGSAAEYLDHVEVAGVWWPRTIRSFDAQGQLTAETKQTVNLLNIDEFDGAFRKQLPGSQVQLIDEPLPSYRDAQIAEESGAAGFEHHLVLMLDAFITQNWDEAVTQLQKAETVADGKPGTAWIRQAVLWAARRNEESRHLLHALAEKIVQKHNDTADAAESRTLALAQYLVSQIAQLGDPNEELRLSDQLKPVYDLQPPHANGLFNWMGHRAALLQRLERLDETIPLHRARAESAPWDVYAQRQYADSLFSTGEHAAARAWLREQLDRPEERQDHNRYQLRDAYAGLLQREHRPDELTAFVAEWLTEEPVQEQPWKMYLAALISANRTQEADTTAAEWMKSGQVPAKLRPPHRAKVMAAISYALGDYHNFSAHRFDPKWLDSLLTAARFWLPHAHHLDLINKVLNHRRFSDSDQADQIRSEIVGQLLEQAPELTVARLNSWITWVRSFDEFSREQWLKLAVILRQRWAAEQDHDIRRQLGDQLTSIYRTHAADALHLPFLRTRIQREREKDQPVFAASAVQRLFDSLFGRPWTAEVEAEALALLPDLSPDDSATVRLGAQVDHLQRFVDSMLKSRELAARTALQAEEHPEELTRTELAKRHADIRREAIEGVVASLEGAQSQLSPGRTESSDAGLPQDVALPRCTLHDWLSVERLYLDLKLDHRHAEVAAACWELIDALTVDPAAINADVELTNEQVAQLQLAGQLKQRVLVMVTWLAARRSGTQQDRDRLKAFITGRIADGDDSATAWKAGMITLLIALDEPEELERQLREWIQGDSYPVGWQLMLGRLLAEQGKLQEAITLFETVQRRQQLSPADHSVLADWYMAIDNRDGYRRSRIETFKVMEEWRLQNWIGQMRQPWYQTDIPLPTELDEDVLFAFQALFEKSNQPGNYVYQLRNFYTACRDFRLLKMIPDSVVGRTPQQVYSFLTGLQDNLLTELRNEATADEILNRVGELRPSATTAIDLRALDLLEAMIERRAAEVMNQPGSHAARAVAALRRAFEREWAEGEIKQMGELLSRMNNISSPPLAAERLQQLQLLHGMTEPGSEDRVYLARYLGHVLFHNHNRREDGIGIESAAIRAYEQAHPDGWPAHLNNPLNEHVDLLESVQRYLAAEKLLQRHIDVPANATQRDWMKQRRDRTFLNALRGQGSVSLGSGPELFRNLLVHLRQEASAGTDHYRYQTLSQIPQVFRTARDRKIPWQMELREYAFEQFPALLSVQQNNYGSLVSTLAQTLRDLLDPVTALEFLVARMEHYPERLQMQWQNAWQQHAHQLAQWRHEARDGLGSLAPRILSLVLSELRRDMMTRQQSNRVIYDNDHSYFWAEKKDEFAATVEAVLLESSSVFADNGKLEHQRPLTTGKRTIVYAAQYLYGDLDHFDRAIEIMLIAHQHDLLDLSNKITLCQWLHRQDRHAESIPLLEPIVKSHPDVISYRVMLITAYHHADRPQQRDELLTVTDAHFRNPGLWTESNIAELAKCCVDNQLDEKAVGYFDEAIPLHQRTQPNRGIGNSTLSSYYRYQAQAWSRLGRTNDAVDAASASVIAWGPGHNGRQEAVSMLRQILQRAEDLDQFTASLDAESVSTGQDSPLIRKQAGFAYHSRGEYPKAITQLKKALALQPHDLQTHQKLLECHDVLNDRDAAVEQLLSMIDIDRHNLDLYTQLAERLKDDPNLSERALTLLVEVGAAESENHQALAEQREKQHRWQDAIRQWQHVARLRALEPTGLVHLTEAQIHEKEWHAARDSIEKLKRREWPGRFSNVQNDIKRLQQMVPQ